MTTVSQAIAARNSERLPAEPATELAIRPGQDFWTAKQQAALQVLGIKKATSADLAVFLHYCQKTGLDPFSRQIYMICRREKQGDQWVDKQTIQISIDGFRVIRDRVAARAGVTVEYDDTVWYDASGGEHDVWLSEEAPAAARVVVLKDGRRFPGVVRTAAYIATKDGKPAGQWRTQPDHMIEKCAEAFALRRAFPHDLGGLYIEEELPPQQRASRRETIHLDRIRSKNIQPQYEPEDVPAEVVPGGDAAADPGTAEPPSAAGSPGPAAEGGSAAGSVTPAQLTKLGAIFTEYGFTSAERDQRLTTAEMITGRQLTGPKEGRSSANLSRDEASALIDTLEQIGGRDALTQYLAEFAASRDRGQ